MNNDRFYRYLDVELFDRSRRTPVLTLAGQQLLLEAEAVLERCLALESHAGSMAAAIEASLALAIEVPFNTLMPVLCEFERTFPHVDLILRHPVYGDVGDLVARGEAQLGIAFAQPSYPMALEFRQLGKLIMSHVATPEHHLAQRAEVSFAELRANRRLVYSAHADKLPSSEYLRATQVWQAENYLALIEMVRAGLGWATLPRQLILRELESGELVELQLSAYPHTDWLVGVDLLWARRPISGTAERWLKSKLMETKVFELNGQGQATTL